MLHRISNIVNSDLSLQSMLEELVALAVQVTSCDACLVYLVDRGTGEVVLRASQLPHAAEIGKVRLAMGEGVTGWVALHRSVVALAANASADARFKKFSALPEDTYEAFLSVPLTTGGNLIGVLNAHHREPHAHTPEEVSLLSFLGEQMAGAIATARLAEQSENGRKRMDALMAVAAATSAESYLGRILHSVCETLGATFDARQCVIFLANEERREFTLAASTPQPARIQPLPMDDSFTGPLSGADWVAVPLFARDRLIGAVEVCSKAPGPFSDADVDFLRVVAGQTATAIENARLISETEEMKRTLETRKLVERAKGILQYKHQLTEEEAYLRLRNESRRLRRPMRELAEAVILADELERKERPIQ
ncbi:MAG: GAF domain-containing protein [Candidatus Solibacter usitatus]|nr:GAF domain-containing protein [Candidatus Solibacter usitatus]